MADDTTEHFYEILKDFSNAMLITHGENGQLHARPMAIAEVEDNGQLWFATSLDSAKAHEIEAATQVALTLQDSSRFITISGTASLVQDRNKIHQLWKEIWKLWFPEGKDSANLVLLKVSAEAGEYWDNAGVSKLKFMLQAAKAYATHTVQDYDSEQNAKVSL